MPNKQVCCCQYSQRAYVLSLNHVYFEKRSFSSSGSSSGLFNALSERGGASGAVKDVFSLSEGKPV